MCFRSSSSTLWLFLTAALISVPQATRSARSARTQTADVDARSSSAVVLPNITFNPPTRIVVNDEGVPKNLTVDLTAVPDNPDDGYRLCLGFSGSPELVVEGLPPSTDCLQLTSPEPTTMTLELLGRRIGRGRLVASLLLSPNVSYDLDTAGYEILVVKPPMTTLAKVTLIGLSVCMFLNILGFSCLLSIDDIRDHLEHPAGLFIGYVCQFALMPAVTFLLGWAFNLSPAMRYSLLVLGCSPGGGPSNFATTILRGDLGLSVMMTFTSSLLSIGMMPLWLCTLGQHILRLEFPDWTVEAPWIALVVLGLAFSVPTVVGVYICWCSPKLGRRLSVVLRASAAVVVLGMAAGTFYANRWIYTIMDSWQVVTATTIASHLSYIISFLLAKLIGRRSLAVTATIAIEAGIQSIQSMLIVLLLTSPVPEGHMGFSVAGVYLVNVGGVLLLSVLGLAVHDVVRRVTGTDRRQTTYEVGGDLAVVGPNADRKVKSYGNGAARKTSADETPKIVTKSCVVQKNKL